MIRLNDHLYCIECLVFAVTEYKQNRNPLFTPHRRLQIGDMVIVDESLEESL